MRYFRLKISDLNSRTQIIESILTYLLHFEISLTVILLSSFNLYRPDHYKHVHLSVRQHFNIYYTGHENYKDLLVLLLTWDVKNKENSLLIPKVQLVMHEITCQGGRMNGSVCPASIFTNPSTVIHMYTNQMPLMRPFTWGCVWWLWPWLPGIPAIPYLMVACPVCLYYNEVHFWSLRESQYSKAKPTLFCVNIEFQWQDKWDNYWYSRKGPD